MKRQLLAVVVAVACVLFGVTLGSTVASTLTQPCPSEDSINCTWYGDIQGNRVGLTFTCVGWDNDNPLFCTYD